jgi:hypothetical protein
MGAAMSGTAVDSDGERHRRVERGRRRGDFRVVQRVVGGEELYVVVGASGVALYTFGDVREATAEAAELNSPNRRNRLKPRSY